MPGESGVSVVARRLSRRLAVRPKGVFVGLDIDLDGVEEIRALVGPRDRNLHLLRERFGVTAVARRGRIRIDGPSEAVEQARDALVALCERLRRGEQLEPDALARYIDAAEDDGERLSGSGADVAGDPEAPIRRTLRPTTEAKARTEGQGHYLELMSRHDIVLCTGPAGTGKTFLAVAVAVAALKQEVVRKIVLCRPAVEAGEKLGYLPGDVQAKINPYLRPLYDALNEVLDLDTVAKYIEREVIEVVPLAYMRGRTLNSAFIILDEGQNTTREQMKMFLTRMGEGSRIVVTGDITQVDLPHGKGSGLVHAQKILRGVDGIALHAMSGKDIVRHALVWKIVNAYDGRKGSRPR